MCSKENPMWSEFGKAFLLLVGSHHSPPTGHCFPIWRQPLPLHVSTVTWWMYVGQSVLVLIRTDRCSDVPIAPSADQQNNIRLQHGGSWFVWHTELQQIGRSLQTQLIQYSPEGWSHSERSKFIVPPGPSHLTTCHWPPPPPLIPNPPSNPFGYPVCTDWTLWPSSSSWHHKIFMKVKRTPIKRFVHVLCIQTTDSVLRNLQIWAPFLVIFRFLDFRIVAPCPFSFTCFIIIIILLLFFAASPNEMGAYLRGTSPRRR